MEIHQDTWIWVIVQNPGANEKFLGQHYEGEDISYVPVFFEKSSAEACFTLMKKDDNLKYEAQAIQYGLLAKYCTENGFLIFICTARGEVLQRIDPA